MYRNYHDPAYKLWRQKVYERDRYRCRWPNCKLKRKLNAHHIKTWANYPSLRFNINNGITLCKYHHDLIKNNEEIYEAIFLKILSNDRLQ
jgi:predicted restriction endonuclease